MKEFQVTAKGINLKNVAITDYRIINPNLAKVIISTSVDLHEMDRDDMVRQLVAQCQSQAAPIEGSFRKLTATTAVGFMRLNPEIVAYNEKEVSASYRVVASNMLMDKKDESLWEVKTGAAGKYLCRHGNEDLSELVEAARITRFSSPKISSISISAAKTRQVVAFVDPKTSELDYGLCVRSSADNTKCQVVARSTQAATTVPYENVVGIYSIPYGGTKAQRPVNASAASAIEYYKQLYFYDSAYLDEIIRDIESDVSL